MAQMTVVQVGAAGARFEAAQRAVPQPGPGTVRVKVEACGLCHSDSFVKEGHWPGLRYPRVPGLEVARRATWTARRPTPPRSCRAWAERGSFSPPRRAAPPSRRWSALIAARRSIQGWPSGTSKDSEDALAFCARSGVRPIIESFPLARAADAYERMITNRVRLRAVLTMPER